ncbi:hypothetical protein [Methanosarcina sp. 2.H.A.1B.4]|uniref:hypothetical protein n=1 Tax=Methanosarcina sp. 2.H.A.1B.4 TaxID=1483600 RepID=UPI00138E0BEB|nr:hypothetical protein [Methanosarcina sp. 2.H.A.1B.4]
MLCLLDRRRLPFSIENILLGPVDAQRQRDQLTFPVPGEDKANRPSPGSARDLYWRALAKLRRRSGVIRWL